MDSEKKYTIKKSYSKIDAAIKIATNLQKIFRQRQQKRYSQSDSCNVRPISLSASKADNIYICMNKDEVEIPLVNIFTFKENEGILKDVFFTNLYDYMKRHIMKDRPIYIKIIEISDESGDYLSIVFHKNINDSDFKNTYLLPFIFYILKNTHINLKKGIVIYIAHPYNFSSIAGIHKDYCIYTSITYVNSTLTTEIAFDVENINLDWFTCSPLFRFDTVGKLSTLWFSDKYILHTIPIYEEEGKDPSELNEFADDDTMIEEIIDEKPQISFAYDPYVFLKQLHRQKIKAPTERKILSCFFYEVDNVNDEDFDRTQMLIRKDEMEKYKIQFMQEKIELSEDAVESIRTSANLGSFEFRGGKHKKTMHKRKNKKQSAKKK